MQTYVDKFLLHKNELTDILFKNCRTNTMDSFTQNFVKGIYQSITSCLPVLWSFQQAADN